MDDKSSSMLTGTADTLEDTKPSYWLDACEDISCDDLIPGEFPPVGLSNLQDTSLDPCFFDGILDSIPTNANIVDAQLTLPSAIKVEEDTVASLLDASGVSNGLSDGNNGNSFKKSSRPHPHKHRGCDDEQERFGKRARIDGGRHLHLHLKERERERPSCRKRARDYEEKDRRDNSSNRSSIRRKEQQYGSNGRRGNREMDWREGRGYWERDRLGTNDMVFRPGSWESGCNRDIKPPVDKNLQGELKKDNDDDNSKKKVPKEHARKYQLDVLEQAKNKNTIAFLETGAGKTLIAVLLIKSVCNDLHRQGKKMLAVFLVPKVPLVYQQAEVIRDQTGYQVGHYCGEMGQDFWDARRWQREFEKKQVLVMTAQILLNILRHSIIKMEAINLLILDECHHAVKKHPYSLVMSEFYHTTAKEKRPSVFGMTASPVNLKGVSSQVDCAIKIRNLETKLDSVVCTIKDRKELEKHVPMPIETVVEYDKAASLWSLHEQIKQMEVEVEQAAQSSSRRSKWQFMGARDAGAKEELRQVYGVSERTEGDGAANLIQKLRAINYALGELGQWCAYKVAQSFLTALQSDERANFQLDIKFQESYLSKVVSLLQCQLSEGAVLQSSNCEVDEVASCPDEIEEGELPDSHVVSGGEHVDVVIGAAVADGKVTPKVQSLIQILLKYQHTEDFRAIIFVERVVAALVLPKVFAELPSLKFINSASLIGHNNSQEMRTSQMQDTISKFRDGRVTLLVATSVAEEGLDIRQCNVVIRFDLAKTVLAYIQSRGRARKPGSDYILMVERGNLSHEAFLRNARNSEETLRKEAIERTDLSHLMGTSKLISIEPTHGTVYQVESTGAVVSLNSAVGLVHFYCSQLPSDRYSILRPEFIMERHEKPGGGPTEYSCRLQLPCNAPFERLEGPVCSSMRIAQQAVCLAACKKLHEMGAFTDMLLPDKGSGGEAEKADENDEGQPLPGTARHREFYPEGVAKVLQGDWILSGRDEYDNSELVLVRLYMYVVKCVNVGSSKDPFLTQVSEFAVLFGNQLDAEVLSMSTELFIARTVTTKASLVFRGCMELNKTQLDSLKSFHVRLMSIVLDVDVEPSTTPWDPAKAYLFVPVSADKIDWDTVENIIKTPAWNNPLQKARPDVYLGTNERTLGGDRREYGYGKLRHGMGGMKSHPTYGVRGAVAQFDVVKASGLVPPVTRSYISNNNINGDWDLTQGKVMMADSCTNAQDLVGRIVTAAHSGKRFYVDSVRYDMTAENSFPRKEGYLGPLEYTSYADYYKQKYGVELMYKKQPLIRGRGVSYCKNLLSPRFEHSEGHEGESEETPDKTYYVFLPPELCFVHPLSGSLVRGAQRLPSIMRRVESMLLAVELKNVISYPVPAFKILEALTAASCQETFCYERAELLGDAYLKWVVSRYLFLKHPQKHEGQLTRMRQQMVSNMVLYHYALTKGLQSYIQADRFAPSRWAAPGVLPVFDEDIKETSEHEDIKDDVDDDDLEDGELEEEEEGDSSSYRVLSSKTLADVVEALIGVYYVEGGKQAANHLMKWIGIEVEFDWSEVGWCTRPSNVPDSILRSVDFEGLEGALNIKFNDKGLLIEAITHASRPSSGVSCYQRLEFVGDAVLDHLITKHLFFMYTDLPPGRLTDLRAAAVNNENFARVAVKHNLHLHLRHGSSALEKQIRDFVKEVESEVSKPGFNSFGLGDCKAPKVLGDIIESIAGAIFLDSERDTSAVWKVFQPLLQPMVTPETLPMHPVRELQERCQQQAEGLEYKATRNGNVATVQVLIDGVEVGVAQNPQKKMAQKLAARNALAALKTKQEAKDKEEQEQEDNQSAAPNGNNKKNATQTFTRQTLNDICLRRNWPMPLYRCVSGYTFHFCCSVQNLPFLKMSTLPLLSPAKLAPTSHKPRNPSTKRTQLIQTLKNPTFEPLKDRLIRLSNVGQIQEAISVLDVMTQQHQLTPDLTTFSVLLKSCIRTRNFELGKLVHSKLNQSGIKLDAIVLNSLISLYSKCGDWVTAKTIFDSMGDDRLRDLVSWSAMISCFAHNGFELQALLTFIEMLRHGEAPNQFCFSAAIQACCNGENAWIGEVIFGFAIKTGYFESHVCVGCALLDLFSKGFHDLESAKKVFDKMSERNSVTWTLLITRYAQMGHHEDAIHLFSSMLSSGFMPDRFTLSSVVSACAELGFVSIGQQLHSWVIKSDLCSDVYIGCSLVDMYAKCATTEPMKDATKVFERMPNHNVMSWTAIITGYAQSGGLDTAAIQLYKNMITQGHVFPNHFTFSSLLKASGNLSNLEIGKQIHTHTVKSGLASVNCVGNSLITMYARSGIMEDAQKAFEVVLEKNLISYNAIVDGYVKNTDSHEAFKMFNQIEETKGTEAVDSFTFASLLSAAASLGALGKGEEMHARLIKSGFDSNQRVCNALISMYSRCGDIEAASRVFSKMEERNVISWTSIITGFAKHGFARNALEKFDEMVKAGVKPNEVTYVSVLSACSHVGMVDEGLKHFDSMYHEHKINPKMEHYACVVDLLGRSGFLEKALDFIKSMPFKADALVWRTLLAACQVHGDAKLGKLAAKMITEQDPDDPSAYILLSNLYASKGEWDSVVKIRKTMKERNLMKEAGCSWIEAENQSHKFYVGDTCHPRAHEIYKELDELVMEIKKLGYVPDTGFVLHELDEKEKEGYLVQHSEKIAVAFGLISSTSKTKPIRVLKNLRVCGDCHTAMKYISVARGREIVVRDSNRFHHFKNGSCSCNDYW